MSEPLLFYISFGFTIGLIIAKFSLAFLLYKIVQKSKENELGLGAALMFLFNGISRIIMVVFDYGLTRFNPDLYFSYLIIYKIGFLIGNIGYICLIFISERVILKFKSKYIISMILSIFIIIALIPEDINIVQLITVFPTAFAMIYIPLSYLYLARYDKIRARALSIFGGYFIFFLIGSAILAESIVQFFISLNPSYPLEIRSLIHIISVCFKLIGMGLILYGYRK